MSEDNSCNKCKICNKKSIYNMKCRCEHFFCRKHFQPEKHECKFDFSKQKIENLQKEMPKVENSKINKI